MVEEGPAKSECSRSPIRAFAISLQNHRILYHIAMYSKNMPASVAQLDVCPTGDQEIAGSIPAGSATFFHGY